MAMNQQQEAPLAHYRAAYRALDPREAAARCGVGFDETASVFRLTALNTPLRAAWPAFELAPDGAPFCPAALLDAYGQILTLRYLIEGRRTPAGGGFKSYRELPWGEVYDRNFQGRCILRLARTFGARLDAFASACEALGGARGGFGDMSYDLPYLGGVTVRLILWAGDDEFPPSAQILFSDNTPSAFNAEDLAGVGEAVIAALREAAGR